MAIGDFLGVGLGVNYPSPLGESLLNVQDMWAHINSNAMQAQAQQHGTQSFPPNGPQQAQSLAQRAREMFLKRMGGIRAEMKVKPGDFVTCHIHGEIVHLFYCFSGKAGVAQESIDLFPSDQFITQFRLILS